MIESPFTQLEDQESRATFQHVVDVIADACKHLPKDALAQAVGMGIYAMDGSQKDNILKVADLLAKESGVDANDSMVAILDDYSSWLHRKGYIDSDFYSEEPKAVQAYLKEKHK